MMSKILNKNFFVNLLIVFSIFFFDRLSKIYVVYLNDKFLGSEIYSSKFLNIKLIWNKGIAFGLFSFDEKSFYNILTIIISLVIIIILYLIINNHGKKKYALIMIFAGAIGNLYDRIFYKGVPDFIDFHIGEFHWFIFNVSDIFITIGVILMIVLELISNKNCTNQI